MPRRAQLITIFWRDIPTQVNASMGRDKHQVPLKPRFMQAVDRAAMKADLTEATAYIGEMRRVSAPLIGDDLVAAAEAEAERLDAAFPLDVLNTFVATGGWDPDRPGSADGETDPAGDDEPPMPSGDAS